MSKPPKADETREERLARALRENLRRRKAQAKERKAGADTAPKDDETPRP